MNSLITLWNKYVGAKNITWLVALSLVAAISQFIIYRIVYLKCGAQSMGIWALFAAVASVAQIASFGLGPALIRMVPVFQSKNEGRKIKWLLATVNTYNIWIATPVTMLLYWPAVWYGNSILDIHNLDAYKDLLPAGLLGLVLNNFNGAYLNLLDGYNKFYLRSIIQIISYVWFIPVTYLGVFFFGLTGVAYAFLSQHVLISIGCAISASSVIRKGSVFPIRFSKNAFGILFGFSMRLQLVNILTIVFDPLVKYFIAVNAGLKVTANYEIANKVVVQIRSIMANAMQTITPKSVYRQAEGTLGIYYEKASRLAGDLAFIFALVLIVCAPLISVFFSGQLNFEIVFAVWVMTFGWFINSLGIPGYYVLLGLGRLKELIFTQSLYSIIICLVGGFVLGNLQALWMPIAPALSVTIAGLSVLIQIPYILRGKMHLNRNAIMHASLLFVLILVATLSYLLLKVPFVFVASGLIIVVLLLMVWRFWNFDFVKQMQALRE